jgi:hypothetical protein
MSKLECLTVNNRTDRSDKSFRLFVVESTATEIVLGKNLKQFTIDLNDLVDDIGPLLNKRAKKSTVANGRDFDKICGATVSNEFDRQLSWSIWPEFLIVIL